MTDFEQTETELFDASRAESRPVFLAKNKAYGASYQRHGLLGVLVRMDDKLSRAWRLLHGENPGDEALKDTLLDLENYATIARICWLMDNLKGEKC